MEVASLVKVPEKKTNPENQLNSEAMNIRPKAKPKMFNKKNQTS